MSIVSLMFWKAVAVGAGIWIAILILAWRFVFRGWGPQTDAQQEVEDRNQLAYLDEWRAKRAP